MTGDAEKFENTSLCELNEEFCSQSGIFFKGVTKGFDKRGLTGSLYLVKPVQILYHLAILMSARPLRVNHMKPKPFFTDQAVGLVLKRRINATPQESSDAAQRRSHALRTLKKWTDETKWTKGGANNIFPVNIDACILPPFYFISVTFPPPTESSCRNYS